VQAFPHETQQIKNINVNKINSTFEFALKKDNNCVLAYSTHFQDYSKKCNLSFHPIDLKLETDKQSYLENETILIDIFPKDTEVEVYYANQTLQAKNVISLKSVYPYNRVILSKNGVKTEKIIAVKRKETFQFFANLGVFSTICYGIYAIIKKYFSLVLA
jgi:hypothetical protein